MSHKGRRKDKGLTSASSPPVTTPGSNSASSCRENNLGCQRRAVERLERSSVVRDEGVPETLWEKRPKVWKQLSLNDRLQTRIFAIEWRGSVMTGKEEFGRWITNFVGSWVCGYCLGSSIRGDTADYLAVFRFESRFSLRSTRKKVIANHVSLAPRSDGLTYSPLWVWIYTHSDAGKTEKFLDEFRHKAEAYDEFAVVREDRFCAAQA